MSAPFYYFRHLSVCLLIVIFFSESCKKPMQPPPAPTTGITGVVYPLKSASQVIAIRERQTYTSIPDVNGKFIFQNLVAGTYILYAVPDSIHSSPRATTVMLQSGQQVDVGQIILTRNRSSAGTAALYINCSPTGAATAVKATNLASHVTTTFQPSYVNAGGAVFSMTMPAGLYTVSVLVSDGYQAPRDSTVTLITDSTCVFPPITVLPVILTDGAQVSGTLAPPGIVTKVILLKSNSSLQYSVAPDAAGRFSFLNVAPGTYSLSGTTTIVSGYYAPALSSIAVNANQRVDLGTINLVANTRAFSYYENDTIFKKPFYVPSSLSSSKLTIGGVFNLIQPTALYLTIEGFNGPGQYVCSTATGTNIQYQETYTFLETTKRLFWNSNISGGSGTITVTNYDSVAKKVSGTFSGTLQSTSGTNTMRVSKGIFTDIVYPYSF